MLKNYVLQQANAPLTNIAVNLGATPTGNISWAVFPNGTSVFYFLDDGVQQEWGIGTFNTGSPNTLSRTTVLGNSAGTTARINFTGAVNVYNEVPAERVAYLDASGILQLANGVVASGLDSGGAHFRAIAGSYGVFLRNDGSNAYFLQTAANDQRGGFNSLRPFSWNLSSGAVNIDQTGSGATFGGLVTIGAARIQTDGNIFMPWFPGGDFLSNIINQRVRIADSPTFADLGITGLGFFKSLINQALKSTDSPTHADLNITGLGFFKSLINQALKTTDVPTFAGINTTAGAGWSASTNGTIHQWGFVNTGSASGTTNYAIQFPHGVGHVAITPIGSPIPYAITFLNNNGFVWQLSAPSSFYYHAIGN